MDPISLLMAAQAAVSAIRKGCEMLKEGKAEIDKFKKDVEGGVANAKAIYKEVTGLWGWIKKLFGGSSGEPAPQHNISIFQPQIENFALCWCFLPPSRLRPCHPAHRCRALFRLTGRCIRWTQRRLRLVVCKVCN